MIQIASFRHWFKCAAITVDDNGTVHIAFGYTKRAAERKLIRDFDKKVSIPRFASKNTHAPSVCRNPRCPAMGACGGKCVVDF